MSQITEEIQSYYDDDIIDLHHKPPLDTLMHYGIKRRSGRYPWGSGENPYQHSGDFLARAEALEKQGITYTDPKTGKVYTGQTAVAKTMGLSSGEYRTYKQIAKNERRELQRDRIKSLQSDGYNNSEIARIMGFPNESSVRNLLNEDIASHKTSAMKTADVLREVVNEKRMVDIGAGVELELGVSENTLKQARYILEGEGYHVYGVQVPNATNPKVATTVAVLCKPEVEYKDVYANNMGDIKSVKDYYSPDGGLTFRKLQYPASIDSSRVGICYGDEGGASKDGVIELRRGVADLDLGNSHYAQVRILVDGTHYLKGMAMYSDDLPDGVDIMFNTNKKSGTDKMKVLKEIKSDPDNPFGAAIKANGQSTYKDPKTGEEKLSPINKLKEEGDWDAMSKNLSSQFLSKQPVELIKNQLNLTYKDSVAQYDEICSLTNPTIKRKMLNDFADECDSACVHLKAVALPRQSTQVILPVNAVKETEIYAPNYKNGEKVALIRYPHGGNFEIPVLTVNNKNKSAESILGPNIKDAVGINAKVAERLSGADFDGDQVVVIPTNSRVQIKSTPALKELKGFDPKEEYSTEGRTDFKPMSEAFKQKQMGVVSNLITDMTLKGAPPEDIAKAVKHSMVVIDAVKHKLDYKQSEKDNDIALLKKTYQTRVDEDGNEKVGGAATLLSKRKQTVDVPERQGSAHVDPETGKVSYKESGRTYIDKDGKEVKATTKVKLLNQVEDAHTLSTGTPQEELYANYINQMKALANQARKEAIATGRLKRSESAAKTYEEEVKTLKSKLNVAMGNAPRERQAQIITNSVVKAKIQANPEMTKKDIKKARQIAITNARAEVGATGKDTRITITDKEWEAIQAGAISDSMLTSILRYTKDDEVAKRATPKATTTLSQAQISKIKAMKASGYTNAEIAERLGKSTSTISKYLNS